MQMRRVSYVATYTSGINRGMPRFVAHNVTADRAKELQAISGTGEPVHDPVKNLYFLVSELEVTTITQAVRS